MKQILAAIGIFIVIVLVIAGLVLFVIPRKSPAETKKLKMGDAIFQVEIADTPAEWVKGLSGRQYLVGDAGMFFTSSSPKIQQFWMKGMNFSLDIIWIRDNQVVGIVLGAEPEPGPDYTIYTSPEAADKVLEINAGLSQKLGIKIGDVIELGE